MGALRGHAPVLHDDAAGDPEQIDRSPRRLGRFQRYPQERTLRALDPDPRRDLIAVGADVLDDESHGGMGEPDRGQHLDQSCPTRGRSRAIRMLDECVGHDVGQIVQIIGRSGRQHPIDRRVEVTHEGDFGSGGRGRHRLGGTGEDQPGEGGPSCQ